ncbi:MAG: Uma2 family endonuclease [Deltaproteobacteria bacterium]|nr:Uma2 family endonuclease [Deltaproteobacteria bacterium]
MIESNIEYVLIAQDKRHVEHFFRQVGNRWLLSETNRQEDTIELTSIACNLMLTEVYDKGGTHCSL